MPRLLFALMLMALAGFMLVGCGEQSEEAAPAPKAATIFDGETHFANLTQITFGGQNAEAYWSADGSELIFQATVDSMECDAIFKMKADGSECQMISSGQGATTCAFIAPDDSYVIYASTHLGGDACPPKPDMSRGYTWALYDTYDVFKADPDGSNVVRLTETDGYDAEGVIAPDGSKILFTSVRDGDLDLYMMDPDGGNVERITNEIGYDGGAFFSRDSKWIVWRASRPHGEQLNDYLTLLADGLIRPGKLNIYIMNLEDREPIQLTDNDAANFAPFFHPSGEFVIFSSNMNDPRGRNFDLYTVNVESKEIQQVTFNETFDSFPMFSYDGTKLVFASNRDNAVPGETNIFVCDWVN